MSDKENIQETTTNTSQNGPMSYTNVTNSTTDNPGSEAEDMEMYKVFPKNVPSSVNVNPNLLTVKFECNGKGVSTAFHMELTVGEMKERLGEVLELDKNSIILYHNDIETNDSQTLANYCDQPHGKVVFEVSCTIGESILLQKILENIPTIDVLTSHIDECGFYRDVVVGIENQSAQKQWLKGYFNKLTGTVYYNAYTQTSPKIKGFEIDRQSGEKIPILFERDTQTFFPPVEKSVATLVNKATQMYRSNFYQCSKNDKIMTARKHKAGRTSVDLEKIYVKSAIIIQRAVRSWILRTKIQNLIDIQLARLRKFKDDKQKIILDQDAKERAVITGAVYPVKRDDFYALYLKIDQWWKKEWKRICDTKRSEAKKAASLMLLEKETELLKAIEKHKTASKAESLKKLDMRFLERTSRPVLFRNSKGHLTTIDFIETQKAREFKEIYSALTQKDMQSKEKVELLITLKKLFESHYMDYEYSSDIISLIDRFIQLLGIGFKTKELKGLQCRIELLFLNFLHQTEFNPSAKSYKQPNLPKTIHQTFRCIRCLKLLPASGYFVHVRMSKFDVCKSCTWMQNIAHKRADMSPYLQLLHQVQNSEMQKCCFSAICFILQPIGLAYLTNGIWHGHSAISECSNISKLRHVRWLKHVEWAPWNTILLTDQEAKLHENIHDVFTFYDKQFIDKVWQKHILARKRFIPLLMMDHDVRTSGQWSSVKDSGVFLHPKHAEMLASDNTEYDEI